jgi:hypothetical protein
MAKRNGKTPGKGGKTLAGMPRKKLGCWTPKRKIEFLALLAIGWTVVAAAQEVSMSQSSVYEMRERDPEFLAAMEEAYEESTKLLEGVAYKKAAGWVERVIQKDGSVRMMEKHDPILLMFLLKARKPKMYRDQVDININETRHIIVDLLPVRKDEVTGKLMVVDEEQPPLLTSGEGNDG